MWLASCEGDVQRAAPPANRPASTGTFTGDTVDTVGAGGTFDTTGDTTSGGGDFGVGGGWDEDGAAGAGGNEEDAAGCAAGPTSAFYLSDLSWIGTPVNGFGPVERDTSNGEAAAGDGRPMSISGTAFQKGLGVHANSSVEFGLGAKCRTFSAYVGADDEAGSASITFEVWVDGQRMYSSPSLVRSGQAPAFVTINVSCASSLRLVVTDGVTDGNSRDHGDWGDAKVTCVSRPGGGYVDAAVDRSTTDARDARDASVDKSEVVDSSVTPEPDASVDAPADRPQDARFEFSRPR
jgi:hypothetical protein